MGWYYTLEFTFKVLPEYLEFVKENYFEIEIYSDKYETLPEIYKNMIDTWTFLELNGFMTRPNLENKDENIYSSQIHKKVNSHRGYLWKDFHIFMKEILVQISSVILNCTIEDDLHGSDIRHYTDEELRYQK